jgi:hypothetical protein
MSELDVYLIPIFIGKNKIIGFIVKGINNRTLKEIYKDWKYWEIENES